MLEGLDQIDWSRLSHAYGPATDVPALIRSLADGAEEDRKNAIYELFGNIVHQGSLYEATAFAVPFLIELLEQPAVPDKEHVLDLLQAISTGWLDCQRYAAERARASPAVAEPDARRLAHYESAHAAVDQCFDVFQVLLEEPEIPVRVSAAFLLATMIDRRPDAAAVLLEAIDDESDSRCRAALLLALMVLAGRSPDDRVAEAAVQRFKTVFDEEGGPIEARLAAGIALLRVQKRDAIPRVLDLVRPYLVTNREIFLNLPWDEANDLFSLIDASLGFAPQARIGWIIEGLGHGDPELRNTAMYCGAELCLELRAAPAALQAHFARLVDDPVADIRKAAIRYLAGMGQAGVECVRQFTRHSLPDVRAEVADALKRVASKERERVSWLAEKRPLLLPSISRLLKTIDRHGRSPKWDDEQQVRSAVISLVFHGRKAEGAVGPLRMLAGHESPWVRAHALRALWKITGDAALTVPLLVAGLRPEPAGFLILDCLRQIGPAAQKALPELRRIIESEERSVRSGTTDDISATDEAFRDAALQAVQAIERVS